MCETYRQDAFSRLEVIVIAFVVVMLFAVLTPQLVHKTTRASRLSGCAENLKQVGLANLIWAIDHDFGFLLGEVSTNQGGTSEYLQQGELFQHFKRLTNELAGTLADTNQLASPKVLACPSDDRKAAKNFGTLANSNLSYFVSRDVGWVLGISGPWSQDDRVLKPRILIGDRNVTNNAGSQGNIISVTKSNQLGWNSQMHNRGKSRSEPSLGNSVFPDGSVRSLTPVELQQAFNYAGATRLVFP